MLQPEVLDLNALVAGMGKMLRPLIGEHIQFSTVPAPDLRAVRADPGQIEQVIVNLVVNARDAMPQGGRLTIQTANADLGNGPQVLLQVTDTGSGMDATTRSRLFEPFFTTQAVWQGDRSGAVYRLRDHQAERRRNSGVERAGARLDLHHLPSGRG
jgi:two-component system cell cycle sensor histidine kinase/response regulator CckA